MRMTSAYAYDLWGSLWAYGHMTSWALGHMTSGVAWSTGVAIK